jgi:hypothetical protein
VVGDGPNWPYEVYSWEALKSRLTTWLEEVKQDLETPDLWAGLQREAELLEAGFDEVTENTPFTPDEQNDIARRLQELAEEARDRYSLSEAQMQVIRAGNEYLVKAADRFGRKDWLILFAGVILSHIMQIALPAEGARDMFLGFLRGAGHIFGLPELPLLC